MAELASDGVMVALEPDPCSADLLARNIERNGTRNVRVRRVGVHAVAGSLLLHTNERHPGGGFIATTAARDTSTLQVPVTTIDELVAAEGLGRVDVVKLDVEGSEIDAIVCEAGDENRTRMLSLSS